MTGQAAPMLLWIDDERPTPTRFTHNALSSAAAITVLEGARCGGIPVELISFDHDLSIREGHDDTSRAVLLWIIEQDFWPANMAFHTANPVGHRWLVKMAQRYAPPTTWVDPRDPWA